MKNLPKTSRYAFISPYPTMICAGRGTGKKDGVHLEPPAAIKIGQQISTFPPQNLPCKPRSPGSDWQSASNCRRKPPSALPTHLSAATEAV